MFCQPPFANPLVHWPVFLSLKNCGNRKRKGCLSHIPLTGGTSRNEGIHRVLNKSKKKWRIGIQFAIALVGAFFYFWNEK